MKFFHSFTKRLYVPGTVLGRGRLRGEETHSPQGDCKLLGTPAVQKAWEAEEVARSPGLRLTLPWSEASPAPTRARGKVQ